MFRIHNKSLLFTMYKELLQINEKETAQKKNKDYEQIVDRKGSPNTQRLYEKMDNLTGHQGSANEIRPFSPIIVLRFKIS